ncbi:MAG: hypothetical protein DRR16_31235 [Candidatus Parabeggiatoa sp. nov. 3]|nr:MAG: hypothetical protein DRR00_32210 [Gammaproteobacteria bacterium]RKZ54665.1 MAG: hypothetical protein DRQ99_31060 [Gammaproteobacteria bacterium]RKZ75511.1 MAG: hypothetical protein DRR16_31235 [Gammaproteobacteria bacterium]
MKIAYSKFKFFHSLSLAPELGPRACQRVSKAVKGYRRACKNLNIEYSIIDYSGGGRENLMDNARHLALAYTIKR